MVKHRIPSIIIWFYIFGFVVSLMISDRTIAQDLLLKPSKRASSAIALTPDGGTLLCVCPDSNSLGLVRTEDLTILAEIAVGVDPRTVAVDKDGVRAYIANRGGDSISVVDLAARTVVTELAVGRRPYGVIISPDGERLYVAEQGMDQIRILNSDTFATVKILATLDRPSGLAISDNGTILYVTHLLTSTLSVFTVGPDINSTPVAISLYPDSNLLQSVVISPDRQYAYIPHTRSNTDNMALSFDTTVFPVATPVNLQTGEIAASMNIALETADQPVGLPFDVDFSPDGKTMWVVNAASNDISVIDVNTRSATAHISVGGNPRGIVLSYDGERAYVNNTLAGTVSVIDAGNYSVISTIEVTTLPLPPLLLTGKRLFHTSSDTRMSKQQWISCNTCHFEGEHDGRTWFFGFAGPRNTTSLLSMVQTYPLRWSAEWDESADGEFAIRKENFGSGLIPGDMYCALYPADCADQPPNQGRAYNLDALAAFMDSLQIPMSQSHSRKEPLNISEQRGKSIFEGPSTKCVTCHPAPLYTDHQQHDVGTATEDEVIGPAFDTPSLRGLYDSAPYFHDGSASSIKETLSRPSAGSEHDMRTILTDEEMNDLVNFLLALPYE